MSAVDEMGLAVAAMSEWVDSSPENRKRDPEALLWGRVSKVAEEHGEAIDVLIGLTGQNPRKGFHGGTDELIKELLDTATSALGAVEHITGNRGDSLQLLSEHLRFLIDRAGLTWRLAA